MRTVALSQICDIQSGGTPSRANASYWGGDILWAKISDLENSNGEITATEERITSSGLKAIRNRMFMKGTLLFAMYGSIGKTAIAGTELSANQAILGINIKDKKSLDMSYLRHWLRSRQSSLIGDGRGVAQKNLSANYMRDLKITLPSLDEQKQIAAILDKAEGLRRMREKAIELTEDLLRSAFFDMFGDPLSNPKGFEVLSLREMYVNNREGTKCGPFGSALKRHEYVDTGIPVWNMDNISKTGKFLPPANLWITPDKFFQLQAYGAINGDILISRAGTVGKMCVLQTEYEHSIISTNLIRLRLGKKLSPVFFVALMNYCKGRVGRLKTGPDGSFTHMNTGVLDNLPIPCPPIELQKKYESLAKDVQKKLATHREFIDKTVDLTSSISERVFRNGFAASNKAA